jgi:hypothetical protein
MWLSPSEAVDARAHVGGSNPQTFTFRGPVPSACTLVSALSVTSRVAASRLENTATSMPRSVVSSDQPESSLAMPGRGVVDVGA